jgi:hypothetical protein
MEAARRSGGGAADKREHERRERERRERRHSSHASTSSSPSAQHAAKKQRIAAAESKQKQLEDEDPFAVTPENVHKSQMIDADTDMILRYFGCLLMRKGADLLDLYATPCPIPCQPPSQGLLLTQTWHRPARTVCTAHYYFHRFYDLHPLHKLDIGVRRVVGGAGVVPRAYTSCQWHIESSLTITRRA